MQYLNRLLATFLSLVLVAGIAACGSTVDDEQNPNPDESLAELIDDENFSTLRTALEVAGLENILDGKEEYTLFAPTNDAFDRLEEGVLDELLKEENRDDLVELLKFHIIEGVVTSDDLEAGTYETLAGIDVTVRIDEDGIFYENARVIDVDWFAKNGVIHTLDDVAIPPVDEEHEEEEEVDEDEDEKDKDEKEKDEKPKYTILELLAADEDFSTLVTALELTGLDQALDGHDKLTLFAPTNDAFDALPEGLLDELLKEENRDELVKLLLFHVVEGKVTSADLEQGRIKTLASTSAFVEIHDDEVFYQGARVIDVDWFAKNGVIHTLEDVAIPDKKIDEKTIFELLQTDEDFSTLVTALELTGLDEALDGDENLTLFAPTNDAFDALPEGVLEELLKEKNRDQLTQILLFHVIAGTLTSHAIVVGTYPTLADIDVFIDIENDSVFYENAQIIGFDWFARNGVIHVLDAVAIPPEE